MIEHLFDLAAKADGRIRDYVRESYLEKSAFLSGQTGAEVFLKLELA